MRECNAQNTQVDGQHTQNGGIGMLLKVGYFKFTPFVFSIK